VLALVLGAAACSSDGVLSSAPEQGVARDADDVDPTSTTSTSTTTSTTTTTTTTTTTQPPPPPPLSDGSVVQKGDEGQLVFDIEQALAANGYWLPVADDGVYDQDTLHAVTAVQKTHDLPRTGIVDFATLSAIAAPKPPPQTAAGLVMEVDLARQITSVVRDGVITEVFDVSTGRRAGWTPRGDHAITREIDGIRNAPLGRLYRPKYFIGGVAFHGYPKVPSEPASHGCVRVTNAVMDHIWDTDLMPKGTAVLVF
jgi:lipoprotein-anchoring transpeptidase ErfK/SrfK